MIKITHKQTGEVMLRVEADTLRGAALFEAVLRHANLCGVEMSGANAALVHASHADLSGANLMGSSFYSGHLDHADLRDANLIGAILEETNLQHANLQGEKMYAANLRHAALGGTDLRGAQMKAVGLAHTGAAKANFEDADLSEAIFHGTDLKGANFAGAVLNQTLFANCPALHMAEGLAQVVHQGPSSLDQQTLRACIHDLPDEFLQGVGFSAQEIEVLRNSYARPVSNLIRDKQRQEEMQCSPKP